MHEKHVENILSRQYMSQILKVSNYFLYIQKCTCEEQKWKQKMK